MREEDVHLLGKNVDVNSKCPSFLLESFKLDSFITKSVNIINSSAY